jgi:hypothetical protein
MSLQDIEELIQVAIMETLHVLPTAGTWNPILLLIAMNKDERHINAQWNLVLIQARQEVFPQSVRMSQMSGQTETMFQSMPTLMTEDMLHRFGAIPTPRSIYPAKRR